MQLFKYTLSLSLSVLAPLLAYQASAAAPTFPMLKVGEWKVETLESSLGPFAQSFKPKPFCIDKVMDEKAWEARAQSEMQKAGLACELKQLKKDQTQLTYQTDCKAVAAPEGKKSVIPAGSTVNGQVTLTHVSDTEYTLDQTSKGTGMSLPAVDLSKLAPEQRKMLESMMGASKGLAFQMTMKQRYTYAQAKCGKI